MPETDPVANLNLSERLAEIADRFSEEIAEGKSPDVEAYVAEYGDLGDVLRPLLTALQEIEVGGLDQRAPGPNGKGVLGDFRIIREIARGGMGVVYEAEQVSMGRVVALKVLPMASMIDDKPLQRFRNEVRATATLEHPHIVSVYSVGEERGVHFYAMQLIRGQSLATVIRELRLLRQSEGNLSGSSISEIISRTTIQQGGNEESSPEVYPGGDSSNSKAQQETVVESGRTTGSVPKSDRNFYRNVARLGIQGANALAHAHEHGIIHRDIKPGNLMLDGLGQLYVTDFGLAHIEAAGVTMTGEWMGTPRYMAPEQLQKKPVLIDHRADIYSLGLTLYELLTLTPAFDANDRPGLLRQITTEEPARPRSIDGHIPRDLETILQKTISKNREERYDTASELADDLQRFLDNQPIVAQPPSWVQHAARWSRRHSALVVSAIVLLLVSTIGLAVSTTLIDRERRRATDAATRERDQKTIALQERNAAQKARDLEQEARQRAERTLDLMVQSLRSPDPARDGRTITVAEVLEQAESQIKEELTQQPAEKARLLGALGETYIGLGLYPDAIRIFEETRNILEDVHGIEHRDTLESMYQQATAFLEAGRYNEAIELNERTLALMRAILGDKKPETVSSMNSLATAYLYVSRYDEAIELLEETVELRKAILGNGHRDTLSSMSNLGSAYRLAGRNDEAVKLLERALELQKALPGDVQPWALELMRSLANGWLAAGQYDEAIKLFEETLERQKTILKDEHPETPITMSNLADAWLAVGQYDKAIALKERALELNKALRGAENVKTLASMDNLANAYLNAGRYDEAVNLHEQTLELRKKILGVEDRKTLESMNNLGVCYIKAGRHDEAILLNEETLELKMAIYGEKDPQTLQAMNNLAGAYSDAGRYDKAIELYEETLELKMAIQGERDNSTLISMNNLAGAYSDAGRYDKAIELYEKTVELQKATLGEKHPDTLNSINNLAVAYYIVDRYEDAIELFEKTVELRKATLGEKHPLTLLSMHSLASAYRKSGRHDEAIKLCVVALKLARQEPVNRSRIASVLASLALSLVEQQKFEVAEPHARECLEIRDEVMPDHWRRYAAMSLLGAALGGQGKHDEAEPLLLDGYRNMHQRRDKIPAPSRFRVSEALQRIVQLYEVWDKPEKAADWKQRLAELQSKETAND